MYINKIDELIDNIIDDFYNSIVLKNKIFAKIISEPNFVKFQPQINKLLQEYSKTIEKYDLSKIVNNQDNIATIVEIIKRYVCYYFFLTIGFFYKKKRETFINNVIEFSKNQSNFPLKVSNFFNSESNSNIIKFFNLSRNIVIILEADSKRLEALLKKREFIETAKFLNTFGAEFIMANFKLSGLKGNKKDQSHNIIKTTILNELYFKTEKKDVFNILTAAEEEKGEYIFIDIVVPRSDFIDFNMIESVLNKEDIENGLAYEIYDLIQSNEDSFKVPGINHDDKIIKLINNNIIVPITDDFMLYHKDTEKYEKTTLNIQHSKKKEDTKIRYIVTKIDKASDLYSKSIKDDPKLEKEIEKLFYVPLSERKAVVVNDVEEIKIINKLLNQGRRSVENNEYYNDLINIRMYPYVNFKTFRRDGFSVVMNKTKDVVRYVTFEKSTDIKTTNSKELQIRIGSEKQTINVVGFIIPTSKVPLQCVNLNNMKDIRDLKFKTKDGIKKSKNGYNNTLKFIQKTHLKNNTWGSSVYWLFDLKEDKTRMEKYEQVSKMNNNELMKLTVSKMYDDIMNSLYYSIIDKINKHDGISLFDFENMMSGIDKQIIEFPRDSELYEKLLRYVTYEKYEKTEKEYDENEDKFMGLFGNVIKLPYAPKKQESLTPTLETRIIVEQLEYEEEEVSEADKAGAICQHNITWDNISALRKKNPNKFSKLLFEFIYQYVIENREDDYICKSCGIQIDIKNYIRDGTYTDEGSFVSFYSPLEVPLEEIAEYEKFKLTIRNIDKIIERLASISNITFLVGNANATKWRRRGVIKDAIDLLLLHNKNLQKVYKNRNENLIKKYGINRDVTNLFVFDLENSIFIYSSKDKDYYKAIKQNNVLIYVLFLSMLELNDGQILGMSGDRTCNFHWFEKYTHILFDNLKIRKNDKGDIVSIKEFPVLCYVLYYMSCMITKYNMWYYDVEEGEKRKKFDPMIQKIVITTTVDFINSVIEMFSSKNKNNLYEMIGMKFFTKLNGMFSNENLMDKLKELERRKIIIKDGKKKYVTSKTRSIKLADKFTIGDYHGDLDYMNCVTARRRISVKDDIKSYYHSINNVTNCTNGKFHDWKSDGKILICSICNETTNVNIDIKQTTEANKNFRYEQLKELSHKYCVSGNFHNLMFNRENDCNICKKCNFLATGNLTIKQLNELERNISLINKQKEELAGKTFEKQKLITNTRETMINTYVKKMKETYGETKGHKEDYVGFIYKYISSLESIIGKKANINSQNIYLRHDVYIIDHDHNGHSLDEPLIIINDDKQIQYKRNHSFFKKDVLFYTNYSAGKIDVFCDSSTYLLLGFKEANKDYKYSRNRNKHIKVNYSILNRIKMLGYRSKYNDIGPEVENLQKYFSKKSSQDIIKEVVSRLGRERIQNLKKSITDIQRLLHKIRYGLDDIEEGQSNGLDIEHNLLKNYVKKLEKMKMRNKDGKHKVFSKWKVPYYNIFFQDLKNKTINLNIDTKYITDDDLISNDYHGNLILFYIVDELTKLISYNEDRYTKVNVAYFTINIINYLFDIFNYEDKLTNYEIQRFTYILESKTFILDEDDSGHGLGGKTDGFYGEHRGEDVEQTDEQIDQIENDIEERDALDIDTEIDYDIDYTPGVNIT
jgi:hypothetical protein